MIDEYTKAWLEIEKPEQKRAQLAERADMECNLHNFGEAKELEKQIDILDKQLTCTHEWKGDGSGMQLSTTYCDKCGAYYAC